ncbi:histone deacetylase [bacterium]|nr:histone deacetylase [candidate division CSSED10-310 bacterium]
MDKLPTGFVFFPAFDWSLGIDHPEREERLLYTRDLLEEEGVFDISEIENILPEYAADEMISGPHICLPVLDRLITSAHRYAIGGIKTLADARMQNKIRNGFAVIRPPGHHAFRLTYGNRGFCNVNNMAILVHYLRTHYHIRKIAVIDTDVHHGDGTQNIFWHDPDTLFISTHQDGRTQYPGTGFLAEFGGPCAFGANINIPLLPGCGDKAMKHVIENTILPILDDFKPEMILNSAGQDCHFSDPLGSLRITAQGYVEITRLINPDLIVLEGGYSAETALPYLHLAILSTLAGINTADIHEPGFENVCIEEPEESIEAAKHIAEQALSAYQQREVFYKEAFRDTGKTCSRNLRIYYDTDGIVDFEHERFYRCDSCNGTLLIDSESHFGTGETIRTRVSIASYHRCSKCLDNAMKHFNTSLKKSSPFHFVVFQDLHENKVIKHQII